MYVTNQGAGSSAANRFTNFATTGNGTPIAPRGFGTWTHDGTTWQIQGHDQGSWITQPFLAGDYTAQGSMTWTVIAGNVQHAKFYLAGRVLHYAYHVNSTSVGGTVSGTLQITVPNGFTLVSTRSTNNHSDNGTTGAGMTNAAGTLISLGKSILSPNWTVSSSNTFVQFSGFAEVT